MDLTIMIQELEIQRRNLNNYQDFKEYVKLQRFLEIISIENNI